METRAPEPLVWVLWIISDHPSQGLFSPKIFRSFYDMKQFVRNVEGCNVHWHCDEDGTSCVATSVAFNSGARWRADETAIRDQQNEPMSIPQSDHVLARYT